MTPSKRVKQWSLGLIIVFALVAVAFVWLRSDPPKLSAFVLDSSLESSVGVESSALDSRANPALSPSYFTIPNPTPSAHASSIVALEHSALSLRDSYTFMALFFAGSREGARDVGIYQSFFVRDSALGGHSRVGFLAKNGDCCGEPAVITTQGNSLDSPCKAPFLAQKSCREQLQAKSAQSPEFSFPQNPQSSHSPTATPRIYEEESRASLRDTAPAVAWQSTLESTFEKVDSSPKAESPQVDSRIFDNKAPNVSDSQAAGFCVFYPNAASEKVDSTFLPFALDFSSTRISSLKGGQGGYLRSVPPYPPFDPPIPLHAFKVARKRATIDCMDSASAEYMDCHADFQSARNDDKNGVSKKVDSRENAQNVENSAKDSRIFDKTTQNVFSQNATRRQDFGDKNGALQEQTWAHTWAYVTADSPQQSAILAQNKQSAVSLEKPTPKPRKAQSSQILPPR